MPRFARGIAAPVRLVRHVLFAALWLSSGALAVDGRGLARPWANRSAEALRGSPHAAPKPLALREAPAARGEGPRGAVAVTREAFEERLVDRQFRSWRRFREALGPEAEIRQAEGADRVIGGLSVALVIVLNMLLVAAIMLFTSMVQSSRAKLWTALGLVEAYAIAVYVFCQWAYEDPKQRLITNFLFGAVPLAISVGSYLAAVLLADLLKVTLHGLDWEEVHINIDPSTEELAVRVIFFVAVFPGLAASIYLGNTVSTGFTANATHFDVLSLCLFIDVGRFFGHLSYVVAPAWTVGPSKRPGLVVVLVALCIGWFIALARLEAGGSSIVLQDRTKLHTLVALTSYAFWVLGSHLAVTWVYDFVGDSGRGGETARCCACVGVELAMATFMLLVGIVFDALEANLMGIFSVLVAVFHVAYLVMGASNHNFCVFFIVMALICLAVYGVVNLSAAYAGSVRTAVLHAFAP